MTGDVSREGMAGLEETVGEDVGTAGENKLEGADEGPKLPGVDRLDSLLELPIAEASSRLGQS